jgi:hypothetical protein
MSGIPPGIPPPSFSGGSATMASVVRMFLAMDAAFCRFVKEAALGARDLVRGAAVEVAHRGISRRRTALEFSLASFPGLGLQRWHALLLFGASHALGLRGSLGLPLGACHRRRLDLAVMPDN